jgi:micrococcal nuclease
VALLVAGLILVRLLQPLEQPDTSVYEPESLHLVKRAVDGDTLLLDDGVRVRLLGVDTPETKREDLPVDPLGLEAAEFTQAHTAGKQVRLKYDLERRDRFHRVLAYVFVDEWFLNEELIRAGYSRAQTQHPYSQAMKRRFLAAEEAARAAGRGLWAEKAREAR